MLECSEDKMRRPSYHGNSDGGRLRPAMQGPTVPTFLQFLVSYFIVYYDRWTIYGLVMVRRPRKNWMGPSPTFPAGLVHCKGRNVNELWHENNAVSKHNWCAENNTNNTTEVGEPTVINVLPTKQVNSHLIRICYKDLLSVIDYQCQVEDEWPEAGEF